MNKYKYCLLALILLLLTLSYHLLRNMKDTLVVMEPGMGVYLIPFLKLYLLLPSSLLIAWTLSRLCKRFTPRSIFNALAVILNIYLLCFVFYLYPNKESLDPLQSTSGSVAHSYPAIRYWSISLFFLLADIWGNILIVALFWAFVHRITPNREAGKNYPFLLIFANLSSLLVGFVNLFLILPSSLTWNKYLQSVALLIVLFTLIALVFYNFLYVKFHPPKASSEYSLQAQQNSTPRHILTSRSVWPLGIATLAFFITSGMMELVWMDALKRDTPDPIAFNETLNLVTACVGSGCLLIGFLMSTQFFKGLHWSVSALLTPSILFLFAFVIFLSLMFEYPLKAANSTSIVILCGAAYCCFSRICKFTFFDFSKEMAIREIDKDLQVPAKLYIDGFGPNLGKGLEAVYIQMALLTLGDSSIISLILVGSVLGIKIAWGYSLSFLTRDRVSVKFNQVSN